MKKLRTLAAGVIVAASVMVPLGGVATAVAAPAPAVQHPGGPGACEPGRWAPGYWQGGRWHPGWWQAGYWRPGWVDWNGWHPGYWVPPRWNNGWWEQPRWVPGRWIPGHCHRW
ncbi:hypothetical protein [Tsukamurella strandjordii]|uniref:YXWGXW repeat-containing protein n=1 Tax=Tsukamurella strandjordii TaxID=147577 RepID=A0AA90NLI9_9ACTN|nr:hypothetical protein [Tsukamurella strandjordii]MDP0400511.1 hypothetical protein [Tsukamurella strandjordii]